MFGCAPAPAAVSAMAKKIAGFVSPALEAIIEALTASHVARSMTGAETFCAIRSYLATTARHGIGALDALARAANSDPWIPEPA